MDIHAEVRHQQFHFLLAFLGRAVKQDNAMLLKMAIKSSSGCQTFWTITVSTLLADLFLSDLINPYCSIFFSFLRFF